ncbi:MAG TPA: DUF4214 domain-containing protein [Candidatus Dormibacteraeota bacterium]|nr:DUF4214 domain-containing protein [Candidatus Dormibacteraeota bacterium]
MRRTTGEGDDRTRVGIEAGRRAGQGILGGWGGRLTICAFMLSAGLVAGVTLHSWQPEFARSPYYSLPYSAATAPPAGDSRPLPDTVPVPLAQPPAAAPAPPRPPAAPATDASPPAPGGVDRGAGAHRAGQVQPVNRPVQILGLTPGSLAFDPQPVGSSAAARTLTVASTGSAPLRVRGVALSGGNASAFVVVADKCSGVTLAPGASCPVSVSFAPDADGSRSATLTIDGDGAGPATSSLTGVATDAPVTATGLPVDCGQSTATRCAVGAMYQQLLGRPADDPSLQGYATQLDAGQTTRQNVATAIQNSDEWRTRLVALLFKALLGRAPDPGSLGYYVPQLRSGTVEQVTAAIAASQEYFARAGGTNDGFVSALYHDVLRHPADAAGKAGWVDQLNRGATREAVAGSVRRSAEAQGVAVQASTKLLLGRAATGPEQTTLADAMVHGLTYQAMQGSLIQTDEYLAQAAPLALTDVVVASFVDGDPKGTASQFTVTVDWGDGSPPAAAVVTKGKSGFTVTGSHTYAAHRSWTATIHIADAGGAQAQTTTTVVV